MRADGGGAAPKKGGGGNKPTPQGPPVYNTYTSSGGYSRPRGGGGGGGGRFSDSRTSSTPRSGTPGGFRSDVIQEIFGRSTQRPGFDMNAVSTARSELEARLKEQEQSKTDYSAYINPHANVLTPEMVRSPEDAERLRQRMHPGTVPTIDEKIDEAKTNLYQARVKERRRAIGADVQGPRAPGRPAPGVGDVKQMTWEDYQNLSPKARAAVDFNTMLVQAVRRDAKLRDEYEESGISKTERERYDRAVYATFGKDGGSDLYSPETVSLLRSIDLTDKTGDLDDYLGLNAAITAGDLKHIKETPGPTAYEAKANPVQLNKLQLTNDLANKTAEMQRALAKGNELLASINMTANLARGERTEMYGGFARKPPGELLGYDDGELSQYFRAAYDLLAQKRGQKDVDLQFQEFNEKLSPSELRAFMNYADTRSKQALEYGLTLGTTEGARYKDPETFRAQIGLGGNDASE